MSGPTVGTEFIVYAPNESQAMARYNGQRGRVTGFCGTIICEIDGGGEVRLSEPLWTSSTLLLERPAGPKVGDEFEWRTSPKLRGKVTKVLLDGFQALFRDGSDRFLAMARWSECFPVEKASGETPLAQVVRALKTGAPVWKLNIEKRFRILGSVTSYNATFDSFEVEFDNCRIAARIADFGQTIGFADASTDKPAPAEPQSPMIIIGAKLASGDQTTTIADPRDAEIARLKSELEAEGAKTRGPDGRTFKDLLGSIATFRERNHLLEAEERRLRFDLASKDREIAKLKLAVKERAWRR